MGSKRNGWYHIEIDHETCLQCAGCVAVCPTQALDMHALELRCDDPLCIGCDLCVRFCPVVSLVLEERPAPVRVSGEHPGAARDDAPRTSQGARMSLRTARVSPAWSCRK